MNCMDVGIIAVYLGESARNGYNRGGEHLGALASKNEKAPLLWRHAVGFHKKNQEKS